MTRNGDEIAGMEIPAPPPQVALAGSRRFLGLHGDCRSGADLSTARDGPMTARQIIEARLDRKWPATRDLAKDQRDAIKRLAIQLIRQAAEKRKPK